MLRKRNFIALGILAVTSLFSLVGLSNHNHKEVKALESEATSTRFILDVRALESGWGGDVQLFLQKDKDSSTLKKLDCKKATNHLIYFVDVLDSYFNDGYNQYGFRKVNNNNHNEVWNYFPWYSSSKKLNYCKATSYDSGSADVNGGWESTSDWGTWSIVGWDSTNKEILNEKLVYENSDSEVYQLVKKSVSFKTGQRFKIVYDSGKSGATLEYHGYNFLDSTARSNLSGILTGSTSNDSDISVNQDITLDFYFKPLNANNIWVQEDSTASAVKFAQSFLDATKDICADNGASDHLEALNKIWSNQQKAYKALTLGAKDAFENSTNETIVHARSLAEHIASRYGLSLTNSASSLNALIERNSTNNLVLMVVLSCATIISMASIIYLVSKKRRLHQ